MGYESLHIMELLRVQCLQVDDVIFILSPVDVYCGFGKYKVKIRLVELLFDGCKSLLKLWFSAR